MIFYKNRLYFFFKVQRHALMVNKLLRFLHSYSKKKNEQGFLVRESENFFL